MDSRDLSLKVIKTLTPQRTWSFVSRFSLEIKQGIITLFFSLPGEVNNEDWTVDHDCDGVIRQFICCGSLGPDSEGNKLHYIREKFVLLPRVLIGAQNSQLSVKIWASSQLSVNSDRSRSTTYILTNLRLLPRTSEELR